MNCPNCGREVRGRFCTNCGAQMPEDTGSASGAPSEDAIATTRISQADLRDFMGRAETSPRPQADPQPLYSRQPSYPAAGGGTALAAPPTATATTAAYPVQLSWQMQSSYSRFWAIPLLGFLAKYIVLIPHLFVLAFVGLGVYLCQLFLWTYVLFGGKYPDWGYRFVGGTILWSARVALFFYGLTDRYPPFGFHLAGDDYPIQLQIDVPPSNTRLWAIPLIGILAKYVILIPHLIVLYVLGLVVGVLQLGLWVPVLFKGQYPEIGHSMVGGYMRWSVRVICFLLGLTDRYPPFALSA